MRARLLVQFLVLPLAVACSEYNEGESFDIDSGTEVDAAAPDGAAPDAAAPPPNVDENLHYPATAIWSPMDSQVISHAKAVLSRAAQRTDVFAKVGDSNTVNTGFFGCLEGSSVNYGSDAQLKPTVTLFASEKVDGTKGSFARTTLAAGVGWTTKRLTTGSPSPLDAEIEAIHPAFAVVMLGTNDTSESSLWGFPSALLAVTSRLEQQGVLPVLSTIPPRRDTAAMASLAQEMNAFVRALAEARRLPLVDVWRATDTVAHPLAPDGIHLTYGAVGACAFTASGLDYGMTTRNLVTLAALDRVRRFVLGNAPPETTPTPLAGQGTFVSPLEVPSLPFTDARDTREIAGGTRDAYPCAAAAEGGNEVVYRFRRTSPAHVRIRVVSLDGADHDVHLLGADGQTCTARDDRMLTVDLPAGETLLAVDGFGPKGGARDGEYLLSVVEVP